MIYAVLPSFSGLWFEDSHVETFWLLLQAGCLSVGRSGCMLVPASNRAPTDLINIRILQIMISSIPLVLGLGTKMSDPYVYVFLVPAS